MNACCRYVIIDLLVRCKACLHLDTQGDLPIMPQSQEHLDMVARAKVLRDTRAQALHGAFQPTRPMDEDSYWAAKAKAERGVAQPKFTPPTLSEVYAPSREASLVAKA